VPRRVSIACAGASLKSFKGNQKEDLDEKQIVRFQKMPRGGAVPTAQSSGCCLCLAFVFALFATVSPYWVWRNAFVVDYPGIYSGSQTFATGAFVLSSNSARFFCGWGIQCVVSAQWNEFGDFNDTACTGEFYDNFGKYGFCEGGRNGTFKTSNEIQAIQGLSISTTVFTFIAFSLAVSAPAPSHGGAKLAAVASFFSLLSMVTSCSAFSVAAGYDWYQSFDGNGFLPFITESILCESGSCMFLSVPLDLYWGPAFTMMVIVFIITFFTTCSLCVAAKSFDDDDLDGANDTGQHAESPKESSDYNLERA